MRSVWDREVGGSNPLAPTNCFRQIESPAQRSLHFTSLNFKFFASRDSRNFDIRRERLHSIDALRGAAALAVVLYHTAGPKGQFEPLILRWIATPVLPVIRFGYAGVFLFFVISGFCIHLSRARAESQGRLPVGFKEFWKRRVRRLYPPYLVSLLLFLLIAGFTSKFEATFLYIWDVLLHLSMLHNLDSRTVYSINGVFWTLAIEEQLYLAYFLLLFMRKRWGWNRTLLICLGARVAWFFVFTGLRTHLKINIPIAEAAASYWFNWALGAMSVEAIFGLTTLPWWCYKIQVAITTIVASIALSMVTSLVQPNGTLFNTLWLIIHPLWGLAFFALLNWFVVAEKRWRQRVIPRLVRLLAGIGLFSYSLYLTHELVALEEYRFAFLGLSPLLTAILLTTPASVVFAWLFFRVAEQPYLNSYKRRSLPAQIGPEATATADA